MVIKSKRLVHDFIKILTYIKIQMSKHKCQTRPLVRPRGSRQARLAGSHGGQVNVKAQSSKYLTSISIFDIW